MRYLSVSPPGCFFAQRVERYFARCGNCAQQGTNRHEAPEVCLLVAASGYRTLYFLSTADSLNETSKNLNHSSRLLLLNSPLLLHLHILFLFNLETPRGSRMPQSSCTLQESNFHLRPRS